MESWVYLFSKFTHEALLLEALILLIGISAYLAYYLTKRRKYGVAGKELPANLVRVYLSQLMADAEDLKIQLFGLLGKGEAAARLQAQFQNEAAIAGSVAASGATAAGTPYPVNTGDDRIAARLAELEAKMAEQASALDSVLHEKMRLEEELAVLRSKETPGAPASSSGPSAEVQAKLKQLENQLAEYAVIEDDLANLKRLQKENKELREQLAKLAGGTLPASTPDAPSAAAPTPQSAAQIPPVPGTAPAQNPNFDALVDQVEASLQTPAAPAVTTPAAATAGAQPNAPSPAAVASDSSKPNDNPAAALAAGETTTNEKTEEQLQADFEKMLNS